MIKFLKRWVFKEPTTESFTVTMIALLTIISMISCIALIGVKFIIAIVLMGLFLMAVFAISNALDHYDVVDRIAKKFNANS